MNPIHEYKGSDDLTPEDIKLIIQVLVRLRAEGFIPLRMQYEEMLEAIVGEGRHSDLSNDKTYYNSLMGVSVYEDRSRKSQRSKHVYRRSL